jgi:hypothetical protein
VLCRFLGSIGMGREVVGILDGNEDAFTVVCLHSSVYVVQLGLLLYAQYGDALWFFFSS